MLGGGGLDEEEPCVYPFWKPLERAAEKLVLRELGVFEGKRSNCE